MGLLSEIKKDVKKSGQNKGKFIYFREGQKQRIRFLQDMDEGLQITFHDSFEQSINVPCQEHFNRECPYCDDDTVRTRNQYIWSVWNYETNEVQLFMFPVNNCSPIPSLVAMYETYGTLVDRDYVISVSGKQQNKTFSVVPMDKVKFRNSKAKPYSEKSVLQMLDKAFPCDAKSDDDDDEDDEDYMPKNKKKKQRPAKTSTKKDVDEDYEDDDDYDEEVEDDADEDEVDYESMTVKELYKLCKSRGIDVAPKKSQKYYIKQLEEYDEQNEDWGDDEDEDEWEEE